MTRARPAGDAARSFDPLDVPLSGRRLVEAGAGTGKTHHIANLYLRLVLGHGLANPLAVGEILVVTFTRAATAELHGRIRRRMIEAAGEFRRAYRGLDPDSGDGFVRQLIAGFRDAGTAGLAAAARRLDHAVVSMDEAAVHTIDSFAMRTLQSFLFETGAPGGIEVNRVSGRQHEAWLLDEFRRHAADPRSSRRRFLADAGIFSAAEWMALGAGAAGAGCEVKGAGGLGAGATADVFRRHRRRKQQLSRAHARLASEWRALSQDASNPGELERRINGEIAGSPIRFTRQHLVKLVGQCLAGDQPDYPDRRQRQPKFIRDWMSLGPRTGTGRHVRFLLRFRRQYLAALELGRDTRNALRAALVSALQPGARAIALEDLTLADVCRLINQRLATPGAGDRLRDAITGRYPVCLVDEFQDTDPEQFRMFNEIYRDRDRAGLFMFGDPRQSIYAFRGADVFAYLDVKRQVGSDANEERVFSLDTNWRSTAPLVRALNRLFGEPAAGPAKGGVFLFEGLSSQAARSCEEAPHGEHRGRLRWSTKAGRSEAALVFIGHPDTGGEQGVKALLRAYAEDTAARIGGLLDPEHGARVGHKNAWRALRPRDVAVLVSNRFEAAEQRAALERRGVGSVYLSQRDSVLERSEIAPDLLHLLRAILQPADRWLLRAAVATPLLRGYRHGLEELEHLGGDGRSGEELVAEFTAYRETWRRKGLLASLNQLVNARSLLPRLAAQPGGERIITDLRHLGELLQLRDTESDCPTQVVDWFARVLQQDPEADQEGRRIRLESDRDLVRIVTIHASKGLEFPVVFLPFFFMPRPVDARQALPLYHDPDDSFSAVIDFAGPAEKVRAYMQKEALAEQMRLLYVAATRAVYRCHIGISAASRRGADLFPLSPWAHLLGIHEARPRWDVIESALRRRLQGASADYARVGDYRCAASRTRRPPAANEVLACAPCAAPVSSWQVTSFTRLAHGARMRRAMPDGAGSETAPGRSAGRARDRQSRALEVRYALGGSRVTGSCLHDILEQYALQPGRGLTALIAGTLARFGLDKPPRLAGETGAEWHQRSARWLPDMEAWLGAALRQPLRQGPANLPSLGEMLGSGRVAPELRFDFAIGGDDQEIPLAPIEAALRNAGQDGMALPGEHIHGVVTGAMDLIVAHDNRAYIIDYKSNLLGHSPGDYGRAGMTACIRQSRYQLQYLIYTVAAHRYFRRRFGAGYGYDPGAGVSTSFGGVFYLFLRGMGLTGRRYRSHGIWFNRPTLEQVRALDHAFRGGAVQGPPVGACGQ